MKTNGGVGGGGGQKATKEGMTYPVWTSVDIDPLKKLGLLLWKF